MDRYALECGPVRDLIVDYLAERQPLLDYKSLEGLSRALALHFWKNIETHHPGASSLRLTSEVIAAWKSGLQFKSIRERHPDGSVREVTSPRFSYIDILTAVRGSTSISPSGRPKILEDDVKPLSIVVALVSLVLVAAIGWILGPGASWWLEHVDGVTGLTGKDLAAAVDAIRGRALALATGLAALVAVYYTARNTDTARRTFQLGERGHDTDRYGKAAEQLGHAQAPVRLAGLYALEQLAENNPSLRQRIVNVISAYLRMPYTPPKDDDESSGPAVPRAAIGGRPDSAKGRDPHEERQVRLTAQRILTAHLRCPAPAKRHRWQHTAQLPHDFWPGIQIDLSGALLIDLDLRECRVDVARFGRVVFAGDADFDGTVFGGDANFGGAVFTGRAGFRGATFTDDADFDGSIFGGDAHFGGANFADAVGFHEVTFTRTSNFEGACFASGAFFRRAVFTGDAKFGLASCDEERLDCDGATFAGSAWFGGLCYGTEVSLEGALVTPEAMSSLNAWPLGWGVESHQPGGGVLRRQAVSEGRQQHELRVQQWAQKIRVKRRIFSRFR